MEDEVIPAMIINELDAYKKDDKAPNGKLIQIRVTGFLERDAKKFMVDLWKLLIEAQDSQHGIVIYSFLFIDKKIPYLVNVQMIFINKYLYFLKYSLLLLQILRRWN